MPESSSLPPEPAGMRRSYEQGALDEIDLAPDPLAQFARWFADAVASGTPEPNAMTLSTVGEDGAPEGRVVLLKAVEAGAFVFYTNHESDKGRALAAHPQAALTFWWPPLERQVRVVGRAERIDATTADVYFASRPRESQLGAVASSQSRVVASRAALEAAYAEAEAAFEGRSVERPSAWGGIRVVPDRVEFWQGRRGRLHDRLRYRRVGEDWMVERVCP